MLSSRNGNNVANIQTFINFCPALISRKLSTLLYIWFDDFVMCTNPQKIKTYNFYFLTDYKVCWIKWFKVFCQASTVIAE